MSSNSPPPGAGDLAPNAGRVGVGLGRPWWLSLHLAVGPVTDTPVRQRAYRGKARRGRRPTAHKHGHRAYVGVGGWRGEAFHVLHGTARQPVLYCTARASRFLDHLRCPGPAGPEVPRPSRATMGRRLSVTGPKPSWIESHRGPPSPASRKRLRPLDRTEGRRPAPGVRRPSTGSSPAQHREFAGAAPGVRRPSRSARRRDRPSCRTDEPADRSRTRRIRQRIESIFRTCKTSHSDDTSPPHPSSASENASSSTSAPNRGGINHLTETAPLVQ